MEYKFREIESKWQQHWKKTNAYKVSNQSHKPKYYVLDMFPYPSGAGLHVGHPLGYIASDIYSRYKRLKGFNVLHPMGFDSFGLPAEQYALETGQHPAETTKKNIANFKDQLDKIGFCYDWEREVQTSDPNYYKWTQWIFLKLFNSYFDIKDQKAKPITELIHQFQTASSQIENFTSAEWNQFSKQQQEEILMKHRLAFSAYGEVNWCEALGTVLANDEVVNGVSERGGHPVEKRKMRQWYLRITAYADRLLEGLETVDFSDSMKEMQKNWIGKSSGAEITFPLAPASPLRGQEPDPAKVKRPGFGYAEYSVNSAMSFENAKEMRKNPTEAESFLWDALRNRNIGYKFRRQHPIENYIADFVCLDTWVIVEVDGGYYQNPEQINADKERDAELKLIGFTTLRFNNEEVINEKDIVLQKIKAVCDEIKITADEKRNTVEGSSPFEGEAGVRVYTTRPDTIFGVDFMVIAPEHELVAQITTAEQKDEIEKYLHYVKSRSDRERQSEVKQITGCFTGAYAINPFDGKEIPIWIAEYVLAGYGTGAIMAVPCGDQRDFAFAKHFNIPITNIIGEHFNGEEANPTKEAILQNSGFLNGMLMKDAIEVAIKKIEEAGIGTRKVNYKMRDAGFSRQRYWGEPFPIVWSDGIALPLDVEELPLELPHVDKYGPGPSGEGPLANLKDWVSVSNGKRETSTMPGYAGSSWYFLRYMDPHNEKEFCNRTVSDYWNQVDLYIGGTEHAVGHLLYSRMWTKVLYDLGLIGFDEPFKKLLNQGMIQGSSRFVYRVQFPNTIDAIKGNIESGKTIFVTQNDYEKLESIGLSDIKGRIEYLKSIYPESEAVQSASNAITVSKLHVDVNIVDGYELDEVEFVKSKPQYLDAEFVRTNGKYICGSEVEKMSKSKYNTVNPDELCEKYGADTFRMYEMFLGPVEVSKPWDTKGIEGVHRFLKKLWRLFYDDVKGKVWNNDKATDAELKVLHKTIKKIEEDTERFSFNTAVSTFMIAVNELSDLKCNKKEILEPLVIMLTPYAPHITAELYAELSKAPSPRQNDMAGQALERAGGEVLDASFPKFEAKYVTESTKDYPVAINGKTRTELTLDLNITQQEVEQIILNNEVVLKWLDGKQPKKIIYVRNKMINVVI